MNRVAIHHSSLLELAGHRTPGLHNSPSSRAKAAGASGVSIKRGADYCRLYLPKHGTDSALATPPALRLQAIIRFNRQNTYSKVSAIPVLEKARISLWPYDAMSSHL